jgi:cytochrome c peroxidase
MGMKAYYSVTLLAALSVGVCISTSSGHWSVVSPPFRPPLGLPIPLPVPAANPLTPEKVQLGRQLFFDAKLSPNNTMSCALCHIPTQGFTVNETRVSVGFAGQMTRRNSPTLYNVAYQRLLFLDGREFSLEDQIISPLTNPVEMGNPSIGYVVEKVRRLPEYRQQFLHAFGEEVSVATLGQALASYERTLLSGNAPFDRWRLQGDEGAVSEEVKQGFALFTGKGQCSECHTLRSDAALFTDGEFYNIGITEESSSSLSGSVNKRDEKESALSLSRQFARVLPPSSPQDLGRYEVTLNLSDRWRYKTPSLRNIALTAPYMHNGVFSTLEEVIDYFNKGGTGAAGQDVRIRPLGFTEVEKQALLTFLHSLTGDNVHSLAQEAALYAK